MVFQTDKTTLFVMYKMVWGCFGHHPKHHKKYILSGLKKQTLGNLGFSLCFGWEKKSIRGVQEWEVISRCIVKKT